MHRRRNAATLIAGIAIAAAGATRAQTLTNPDIGVIGDMRVVARSAGAADSTGTEQLEFVFEELEVSFTAPLNPYMRADVFLGIHGLGPDVEIEEAYLTVLRGLPLSLQVSAGAYLLDFGRINSQHPHLWGWIQRPLMHATMLGEDGLRAVGVRATTLASLGETAVTASGSAFGGDAFARHEDEEAGHAGESPAAKVMGSGRLSAFRQLSDAWSAELGASYLGGTYDRAENLALGIAAIDAKVRWRPDAYRAFVLVAEAMDGRRDIAGTGGTVTAVDAAGVFASAEMQWRRRWSGGGFFDWTEDATVAGAETTAFGAFLAFSPAEETARFSLAYRRTTSDLFDHDDTLTLQFLWSLGPHRVHSF